MAKILFLSHRIPYPPNKGDKIRSWNFLKRMAKEHEIHAGFFIDDAADKKHIDDVAQVCETVCAVYIPKWLQKALAMRAFFTGKSLTESAYYYGKLRRYAKRLKNNNNFDYIFLFSAATAPIVLPTENSRVIADLVDVDSDKWKAYSAKARGFKKWVFAREARTLAAFENKLVESFDASIFVSEDEAALMRARCPAFAQKIMSISNGVDTQKFDPASYKGRSNPKRIIFTGAMDYPPNIEAVYWFAENVWPHILEKEANAEFVIAGAPVSPKVAGLNEIKGIKVTGFVEDMALELQQSAIAVAPMQTARGIQNKILEAMAMGLPVITSSLGNEGINAEHGKHLYVVDEAEVFTQTLLGLLHAEEKRTTIGRAARTFVTSEFAWDQKYEQLNKLFAGSVDA